MSKTTSKACGPAPSWGRTLLLATGLAAVGAPAVRAELASPPIDENLYRQGEVRHLRGTFGRWTVSCDEVTRLRQRYCSLRTTAADGGGAPAASLTVSTGDDGRPAGLIELPPGVVLAAGVKVAVAAGEPGAEKRRRAKRAATVPARTVQVVQCDAVHCYAVWTFSGSELAAFNAGKPLRLAYRQLQRVDPLPLSLVHQQVSSVDAEISTRDFSAAVAASINAK